MTASRFEFELCHVLDADGHQVQVVSVPESLAPSLDRSTISRATVAMHGVALTEGPRSTEWRVEPPVEAGRTMGFGSTLVSLARMANPRAANGLQFVDSTQRVVLQNVIE